MISQLGKFALDALLPSEKPAGALEDERAGRMEGGKIRVASGIAAQIDIKLRSSLWQGIGRLFQGYARLRAPQVKPVTPDSCINGVLSDTRQPGTAWRVSRAGFPENAGGRDSYFVGFGPAIRQVFKKTRDIVVGIRACIAPRP